MRGIEGEQVLLQLILSESRRHEHGPSFRKLIDVLRAEGEEDTFAHDWKARIGHPTPQRIHVLRGGTLPRQPPVAFAEELIELQV
jgi:hypothetical protein